jgi:hypothetical protein
MPVVRTHQCDICGRSWPIQGDGTHSWCGICDTDAKGCAVEARKTRNDEIEDA